MKLCNRNQIQSVKKICNSIRSSYDVYHDASSVLMILFCAFFYSYTYFLWILCKLISNEFVKFSLSNEMELKKNKKKATEEAFLLSHRFNQTTMWKLLKSFYQQHQQLFSNSKSLVSFFIIYSVPVSSSLLLLLLVIYCLHIYRHMINFISFTSFKIEFILEDWIKSIPHSNVSQNIKTNGICRIYDE